ncbi:hypothetical protein ACFYQ5_16315 [Streptomyces sp. NPDC005794]|uniref:hypothetical protein n=1 Tax=Streptomyces sp. NPDC005794 TaxID=3364733 RepID=UPI0036AA71D8
MSPLRAVPLPAGHPYTEQVVGKRVEAVPAEHYARLARIAYLVLAPSLGRNRRVLSAHWLAQRALAGGQGADPGCAYANVRLRVLRSALDAGLPLVRFARPRRAQLPPLVPQVWGLRLFPHSHGAEGLALEQALAGVSGACRAAHVLRGLEGLDDAEVCRVLDAAGVADSRAALLEADALTAPHSLLASPEFDPCSLQVRPADPVRRRRRGRSLLAAVGALLVCGTLMLMPGDGLGGPTIASAPLHTRRGTDQQSLDPAALHRVPDGLWQGSTRRDFTVWPTRGDRRGDTRLLRRALTAWARPGPAVAVSATPGTPDGPPMGPPQLLYAGEVGAATVVLFHDGLRVVRYAEPRDADPSRGAALDFSRVDGADEVAASALVVERRVGRIRYLTAPWVREAGLRDLLAPHASARPLPRDRYGVTDPFTGPGAAAGGRADCRSWPALQLRDGTAVRLMTDLGELTPVRLTSGAPSAPHDVSGRAERESWARTACLLPTMRSSGVRSVNSWTYATQPLPDGSGSAQWVCTRAETWRGTGSRVLAQFQAPSAQPPGSGPPGVVAAHAEDSPACGARSPRVLAGVLWKSDGGRWYVLAAGSRQFTSLTASGGVKGRAAGRLLALPARKGDRPRLDGLLTDGSRAGALH